MESTVNNDIAISENNGRASAKSVKKVIPSAIATTTTSTALTTSSSPSSSTVIPSSVVSKEIRSKETYNWLLHLHYVRGEFKQCCEQINRIESLSEYSWYLKGLIALRDQGNVKEALGHFNQIKSLNDVYYIKAVIRCLLLLGRHNEVSEVIRETGLRMAPNDWQLWFMLGDCYYHSGNIPLAKDAFQHSLQNTNQIEPFLLLSQCHSIEGDTKSAIFVLRRATEISPDSIPVSIRLGQLLMSSDMRSKGVEKFIQLNQTTITVRGQLDLSLSVGSVLQEIRGDIEGALYRYKLSESYESPSIWNNVGLCFASRKKFVAAVSCLKRALYLNPLDHRINYNLGLTSLQLRQYASAFHFFKTSCAICKISSNQIFSLIGVCLESLDDDTNARQAHVTATKGIDKSSSVTNALPIINYAVYLYNNDKSGDNKEAIMELMMVLEQIWLNKKQSNGDFDETLMRTATKLSSFLNISSHMAWSRKNSSV